MDTTPGAAKTPLRAPRPDWTEALPYRPDPAAFLDRSAPDDPDALPHHLTLFDALCLFAAMAFVCFMLATGGVL